MGICIWQRRLILQIKDMWIFWCILLGGICIGISLGSWFRRLLAKKLKELDDQLNDHEPTI